MSIKSLEAVTPFSPRKKEFTVKIGENAVPFVAVELSYLDCLDLAIEGRKDGVNVYALQITKSIIDPDGNRMTYEQAASLPDEIAKEFWQHSVEVNKRDDAEKK